MGSLVEVIVGITVTLVATLLASLGLTLQKKSFLNQELVKQQIKLNNHVIVHPVTFKSKLFTFLNLHLWKIGFSLYLLSSLTGSIFSIGSLPVTLLAPIGAFGLICNTFCAIVILGDPVSWITLLGTFIILIGAIIIGLFGIIPEHERSLEELMILYQRIPFIVYFSLQEALIIGLLIFNHFNEYKLKKYISNNNNDLSLQLPFKKLSLFNNKLLIGLLYGACSILISTQGILFAKSGIELLVLTFINKQNQFDQPLAWIIVFLLIFTALLQLYYLNRGLQYCDILILMPINFILYNISCLFNGLIYYNQWSLLPISNFLLVLFGTLILCFGVALLSFRPKTKEQTGLSLDNNTIINTDNDSDNEFVILTAGDTTPPYNSTNTSTNLSFAKQLDIIFKKKDNLEDNNSIDETSPLLLSTSNNSNK